MRNKYDRCLNNRRNIVNECNLSIGDTEHTVIKTTAVTTSTAPPIFPVIIIAYIMIE